MERESSRPIMNRSSAFSAGCTGARKSKGPGRGWPSASASSRPTAGGSGSIHRPARAPRSCLPCPSFEPTRALRRGGKLDKRRARRHDVESYLLLVDDDPQMAVIIGMLARRARLPFRCQPSVEAAWTALQEERPALVLIDVNLPG